MSGKVICDQGAENLVAGIIKRAIDDYVEAKMDLDWLADTDTAIMTIIYRYRVKEPKYRIKTLDEAFERLQLEVDKRHAMIKDVQRFFASEQYKGYTDISGEWMLQEAEKIYQEKKAELEKKKQEEEELAKLKAERAKRKEGYDVKKAVKAIKEEKGNCSKL